MWNFPEKVMTGVWLWDVKQVSTAVPLMAVLRERRARVH